MGILNEAAKLKPRVRRSAPAEIKRQVFLDDLKAMNILVSRSGRPLEELSTNQLRDELVFASINQRD
jgi:hypothetical protein